MPATIRAAVLIGYPELARDIGLDPLRMLDRVGIPRAALTDPDMRIPGTAMRDLWELCGQTAEDWGLRLMERRPLSVLGPLLLLIREQPTLRDAVLAVVRYHAIHHTGVVAELEEFDDVAIIRTVIRYEPPGPSRQLAESSVYQGLRMWRIFLGPHWRPLSASFMHARPACVDTLRRVFGPDILFNQDFNGLVLHRSDLDTKNETFDPEMVRQVTVYAEGLVRPLAASETDQVREVIEDLLRTGPCNIDTVARRMNLDTRTLQRRLSRSNSGFNELLQEVRLGLALHYLEESDRPYAEIAEVLGFSALSAFSRWHRNNFGQSPSERRDATRARWAESR
ncbi:MAG: AraC family transcriptional regulator [Phenylobacterium sp.]|uniref:AraC family transcriptional regulator n=1 Tax=Phenylobacterium sp. TaxID=1871053 RepID=UPI001A3396DB|nr:AraC family transcriptional regulator [Phenylobacterium sp.]MBJ7408801.1 AraC family transcriptional regulator [Phenylobacterium sp.]